MGTEPGHGMELVAEVLSQKNRREAFELYYFAQPNGINQKHESYLELIEQRAPEVERTAEEIFSELHGKMKKVMGRDSAPAA